MNNQINKTKLLNAGQIGDLLGVLSSTINRWARDGKIPSVILPNNRRMFELQKVVAALKKSNRDTNFSKDLQQELSAVKASKIVYNVLGGVTKNENL